MLNSESRDATGGVPAGARALSLEELRRLLFQSNDTSRDFGETCLYWLVQEQVVRTPDNIAAVCGGRALTYRELTCRANRIAYELRGDGVGPPVRLFVAGERSLQWRAGVPVT